MGKSHLLLMFPSIMSLIVCNISLSSVLHADVVVSGVSDHHAQIYDIKLFSSFSVDDSNWNKIRVFKMNKVFVFFLRFLSNEDVFPFVDVNDKIP